jgi:hypothetical protein
MAGMQMYARQGPNPEESGEPDTEIVLRTREDDLQELFAAITYLHSGAKGSETQLRMAVGEAIPVLQRLMRELKRRP